MWIPPLRRSHTLSYVHGGDSYQLGPRIYMQPRKRTFVCEDDYSTRIDKRARLTSTKNVNTKSNTAVVYNRTINTRGYEFLDISIINPHNTARGPLRGELIFVEGVDMTCGIVSVAALCRVRELIVTGTCEEFIKRWRLDGVLRTFEPPPAPASSTIVVVIQGPCVTHNVFTSHPIMMDSCWLGVVRRDTVLVFIPFVSLDIEYPVGSGFGLRTNNDMRHGDKLLCAWHVGKVVDVCPAPNEITIDVNIEFFTGDRLRGRFGDLSILSSGVSSSFRRVESLCVSFMGAPTSGIPTLVDQKAANSQLTDQQTTYLQKLATSAEQVAISVMAVFDAVSKMEKPALSNTQKNSIRSFSAKALLCHIEFPDMLELSKKAPILMFSEGGVGSFSRVYFVSLLLSKVDRYI